MRRMSGPVLYSALRLGALTFLRGTLLLGRPTYAGKQVIFETRVNEDLCQ
jgi:hypothetical protein